MTTASPRRPLATVRTEQPDPAGVAMPERLFLEPAYDGGQPYTDPDDDPDDDTAA